MNCIPQNASTATDTWLKAPMSPAISVMVQAASVVSVPNLDSPVGPSAETTDHGMPATIPMSAPTNNRLGPPEPLRLPRRHPSTSGEQFGGFMGYLLDSVGFSTNPVLIEKAESPRAPYPSLGETSRLPLS
jgi:hypothetical protein